MTLPRSEIVDSDVTPYCHSISRCVRKAHLCGDGYEHRKKWIEELTSIFAVSVVRFSVMPNHVHLLAAFPDEQSMLKQCESWKRYTAVRINRALGQYGDFWQEDGFDHLVRSEPQFHHYRRYLADNPQKAHLKPGEYRHFSKPVEVPPV